MDNMEMNKIIRITVDRVSKSRRVKATFLPFLLLRLKVGNDNYKEIISTVNKVKEIRRTSKAWINLDFHSWEGFSLKQVMPKPIHDIYFKNDLVDAFSNLSKQNMSNLEEVITRTPWTKYLDSAKKNLLEYDILEAKHKKCRGRCMCIRGAM